MWRAVGSAVGKSDMATMSNAAEEGRSASAMVVDGRRYREAACEPAPRASPASCRPPPRCENSHFHTGCGRIQRTPQTASPASPLDCRSTSARMLSFFLLRLLTPRSRCLAAHCAAPWSLNTTSRLAFPGMTAALPVLILLNGAAVPLRSSASRSRFRAILLGSDWLANSKPQHTQTATCGQLS